MDNPIDEHQAEKADRPRRNSEVSKFFVGTVKAHLGRLMR
jgi:hypothetical protein